MKRPTSPGNWVFKVRTSEASAGVKGEGSAPARARRAAVWACRVEGEVVAEVMSAVKRVRRAVLFLEI